MNELKDMISSDKDIVVMTGAGISTDSGIPDFRSPGGVWSQFRIVEFQEFLNSEEARMEDWRRRLFTNEYLKSCEPNIAHKVVAKWVKDDKCSKVITQNIDGLHQASGIENTNVIELHGSARGATCLSCNSAFTIDECKTQIEKTAESPKCTKCYDILKCDVVMFGEKLAPTVLTSAIKAASKCDLFVVIGSSLRVQPAATLPQIAKQNGAAVVIVNRECTEQDFSADLAMGGEIKEVFADLYD